MIQLDKEKNTLLMVAIAHNLPHYFMNPTIFDAPINHQNIYGNTALMLAVFFGNISIVKIPKKISIQIKTTK